MAMFVFVFFFVDCFDSFVLGILGINCWGYHFPPGFKSLWSQFNGISMS